MSELIRNEKMQQEKPRLCEVMGVDVGQWFKVMLDANAVVGPIYIRDDGILVNPHFSIDTQEVLSALIKAINHPEKIIRLPRLTEPELAICRATGAKWVGRHNPPGGVPQEDVLTMLFSGRPAIGDDGPQPEKGTYIGAVRPELFPSVGLGDLIQVEQEP